MGYFEVHFYNICELKWGKEFQQFILKNWSRFLDDCQTPLDKNTVKPEKLLETLNSVNEAIQFTMEFSKKEIILKKVVEIGIQKALKIPQTKLRQPKTIENNNNLTFISTFNPNNPKIFTLIKSGVNTLVENNINGFKNIRLIHAKRQPPNLKRILTNSLFKNKTAGVFKCSDSRCLCCQHLLLGISYTFKNVGKQFFLKTKMTCDSRNLIYVVICPTRKEEYIGENGIGDSKLRDRVRIYRQNVQQPEHEKAKVEKHLKT